jgi:hypothetical protein
LWGYSLQGIPVSPELHSSLQALLTYFLPIIAFLGLLHYQAVLKQVLSISILLVRLKEQDYSFRRNCMEVLDLPIPCYLVPNTTIKLLPNYNSGILSSLFTQLTAIYGLDSE